MKNRHATAVILVLLVVSSIIVSSLLLENFVATDITSTDTQQAVSMPSIKNNSEPPAAMDLVKNSTNDFSVRPDAPALWPTMIDKEPVIVQRHNLISAWKISVDRQLIDELELGEQLNLHIPQTDRHVTITYHSAKSGRYSQSKIATIDGSGGAYSAYFTLGTDTLYGSIETPEGVFHIEQNSMGEAFIYAASEIRENLNFNVSDAVVVSPPLNDME